MFLKKLFTYVNKIFDGLIKIYYKIQVIFNIFKQCRDSAVINQKNSCKSKELRKSCTVNN